MIFSLGLLLAVLSASPLRAGYLVTLIDGTTVNVAAYWVQGGRLYHSDGLADLDAYRVRSVAAENLTGQEIKEHEAAMAAFRSQVSLLLEREGKLVSAQEGMLKKLSEYPAGKRNAVPKKEKKALKAAIGAEADRARALLEDWKALKLPDFSLIRMRDVKTVQLLSLEASLDQARRFASGGDPSPLAYARANLDQYASFHAAFRDALPWGEPSGNPPD